MPEAFILIPGAINELDEAFFAQLLALKRSACPLHCLRSLFSITLAMPRGGASYQSQARGGGSRGGSKGQYQAGGKGQYQAPVRGGGYYPAGRPGAEEPRGIPPVPMDAAYSNWIQRPFPSEQGNSFMMRLGAKRDRDLVDYKQMPGRMSHLNSECYNRLGKWLSMTSASLQEGSTWALKYGGPDKLHLTGLPGLLDFLQGEDGQKLIAAVEHLNDSNKAARSSDSVKEAVQALFSAFGDPEEHKLADSAARLQMFAKKMYDLSAALNEGFAFMHDRGRAADELQNQVQTMPAAVRRFVQDPSSDTALLGAAGSCYMEQIMQSQDKKQQRSSLEEEDDFYFEDAAWAAEEEADADDLFAGRPKPGSVKGFLGRGDSGRGSSADRLGAGQKRAASAAQDERPAAKAPRSLFAKEKEGATPKAAAPEQTKLFAKAPKGSEEAPSLTSMSYEDWPMAELIEFKELAALEITKANFVIMEAEKRKALLDSLPVDLRRTAGLPLSTSDEQVLAKSADQQADKMVQMVAEVQQAWISKAEEFNTSFFAVDDTLDNGGLVPQLIKVVPSLEGKATELLGQILLEGEDDDKKLAVEKDLSSLQNEALRLLLTERAAAELFAECKKFANGHGHSEPNNKQVRQFLTLVPGPVREALLITADIKYEKIKSRAWKTDVSKVLTFGFLALAAWWVE